MIKIEPFLATDSIQMRALLRYQDEPVPYEAFCAEEVLFNSGFLFWQHWLPCRFHLAPAVYVAKEDGVVLGLISLASLGKAGSCWRVEHLVVHPNHRGGGIAQKLLQYVFALFGSQGVSHFIIEVSCNNSPALSLLAACGFRRANRMLHYQMPSDWKLAPGEDDNTLVENKFLRWAQPTDQKALSELCQDALPTDLRFVYAHTKDDFSLEAAPVEIWQSNLKRLIKLKTWYWVCEDPERKVLTAAIKVSAHRQGDFHLEFIVHPGWQHITEDVVRFALLAISRLNMKGIVMAKVYEYQTGIGETLQNAGWQRNGEFLLLVREHWLKVKKSRALKFADTVSLPTIGKPAINLPYRFPPA